jgi:hypothetical protein
MANSSKLLSGRVLVTPYNDLANSRYEFLGLSQAEPNLGTGSNGSILTISTNNQRAFTNSISITSVTTSNLVVSNNANFSNSSNVTLGNLANVHIGGGNLGYVLSTDGAGNLTWQSSLAGAAGNTTQVQFNSNGSLGASSAFTFNNSTSTVQVDGNLVANTMQIGSGIYAWSKTFVHLATTVSNANQLLYSVDAANLSGAEFHIVATDNTLGARQSTKISSVVYDGQVQNNEYAGLYINDGVGAFFVEYNTGNLVTPSAIELRVTPDNNSQVAYKMLITLFAE